MCNVNCCCRDLKKDGLIRFLFLFTAINLLFSVIALFIRAADCDRYDEALNYLEIRNNGTFKKTLIQNCEKSESFLDDDYYCDVDGKKLKKPNDEVSYQKLFKNWNTAELIIDIARVILIVLYLLFLYFIIQKKSEKLSDGDTNQIEKYKEFLSYLLVFIVSLLLINGLCIMIRAFALTANQDIGLYEDGTQNAFESRIAVNYIFDIIEIVLFAIKICFVLRLKRGINQPRQVNVIVRPKVQQPQPIIHINNTIQTRHIIYSQVSQYRQSGNYDHPLDGIQ